MAVVAAAIGKDASATMATTPVRQGHWCRCNNIKDASNRGIATGNNQPAQLKDKRADKRSGVKDATRGNRVAIKELLPLTGNVPPQGCCAIRNSREDPLGPLEGQRRWR